MELNNNESKISQLSPPAFSLRIKDEKSIPITAPLSPEINNCQIKAILTTDGSIKIFYPKSSPLTLRNDEKQSSKKVFLLKDSMTPSATPSTIIASSSLHSTAATHKKPINLYKNPLDDDDEDDDERYSQYKMTPREIFMPHVCQVGKLKFDFHLNKYE